MNPAIEAWAGAMREVTGKCSEHGEYKAMAFARAGEEAIAVCPQCFKNEQDAENVKELEAARDLQLNRYRSQRIDRIGIPARLLKKGYRDYNPPTDAAKSHLEACQGYAKDWTGTKAGGNNIIMCGSPGTGKTHLACVICRQVATEHDAQPRYTTVSRMIRHIRSTYNRDSEHNEYDAINEFARADLLVIDEVGVKLSSDHERSMLFEIIDERYQELLPTIVISNLKISEIGAHTDERIVDRLSENGVLMIFDWPSHRGSV